MAEDAKKEEGEEDAPAAAAAEPKKGGKWMLIGGAIALVIVSAGIPTTLLLMKKAAPTTEQIGADAAGHDSSLVPEGAEDEEEIGEDEERLGAIFPLDTFVVNLTGGGYLRTQMQLEFEGQDVPQRFLARIVPTRDLIITLLTRKSQSDFEQTKGRDALKSEIKDLINEYLKKEEVKRVYFTQFVIQ